MSRPNRKTFTRASQSSGSVLGYVAAGLVVIFTLLNGVPWASKDEVAQLRTDVVNLRSETVSRNERSSSSEVRIQGHDIALTKLETAVAQINQKLDTLLQRR